MDAEELRLYTQLQPKIREAMGEWQVGDPLSYFGKLGFAVKRNGNFGLEAVVDGEYQCSIAIDSPELIRRPLPIDSRCPERGLWGMVDWSYWSFEDEGNDNARVSGGGEYVFVGTPTLALLKALAHQEGVEVGDD